MLIRLSGEMESLTCNHWQIGLLPANGYKSRMNPQCPNQSSWDMETDLIIALFDEIISECPVDQKRIYLTTETYANPLLFDWLLAHKIL